MKLKKIHITLVLALILIAIVPVSAQIGNNCASPFNINATNLGSQNSSFNIAGGELWLELKIDPSTANRYALISLNDNGIPSKYSYNVYGPFENSYSCGSLGSSISSGSSYSYSNPSPLNNCSTYDETVRASFTIGLNSSTNTRYYMVKVTLDPGAFSNQQSISILSLPLTQVSSGQATFCPSYAEGTASPCANNIVCSTPITICSNFTQTHDCSSCGTPINHNRFYVLDIQYPNTTVNFNVPTYYGGTNVFYSLSNQMIYGPCDPNLMLSSNLLLSFTGQSTSYTFTNTGLYLLNVAIQNADCPIIDIDFVDIDNNCVPIASPVIVDFQSVCTGYSSSNIINLAYNGDFEIGNQPENVTMINSDDAYQSTNNVNPGEAEYAIVQSPFTTNLMVFNNHTSNVGNNGYFMFAHDNLELTTDEYIWKKMILNVLPSTSYTFEAWFTPSTVENVGATDHLNLYINGQLVASKNRALATPGVWEKVDYVWNSDTNTTADLRIEIENNNMLDDGRIFIDDISFKMVVPEMECCNNQDIIFDISATGDISGATYSWDFGDGSPASTSNNHTYPNPGTYTVTLDVTFSDASTATITHNITILDCDSICKTCIGSFAPIPGQSYVISAWAKEIGALATKTSYDNPEIRLVFNDVSNTILGPFKPSGEIIDGWQRIEVEFKIPSTAQNMEILLGSASGEILFDDIRVLPFNSNMKSFVYDPINLRLVAELDERHYATYYEYDEQGMLIRVKKETERGIVTIQESRSNTSKME